MKTLIIIAVCCMALFMLDGILLRFAHLSFIECMSILGCAILALMVWATAIDIYINRK